MWRWRAAAAGELARRCLFTKSYSIALFEKLDKGEDNGAGIQASPCEVTLVWHTGCVLAPGWCQPGGRGSSSADRRMSANDTVRV